MFRRIFLIFNNEDGGYDKGNKPSGYVRLEVRGGTGKMHVAVQNLKPGNGMYKYGVYLLKTDPKGFAAVRAGFLDHMPNKAELEWCFEPGNISSSGYRIDEIDCIAVLVEYLDRVNNKVICPLAAYKNGKVVWREKFKTYMIKRKDPVVPVDKGIHGAIAEMTQKDSESVIAAGKVHENKEPNIAAMGIKDIEEPDLPPPQGESAALPGEMVDAHFLQATGVDAGVPEGKPEEPMEGRMNGDSYAVQGDGYAVEKEEYVGDDTGIINVVEKESGPKSYEREPELNESEGQPALNVDEMETGLNEGDRGSDVNTGEKGYGINEGEKGACTGSVALLKEELSRNFGVVDPFNSKRSDYQWWEIDNPVVLNDLLFKHGVPSLVMANPVAIMAHYRYRHLLVGVFAHKEEEKDYIVFGIPAIYMVDAKPFGEMGRWVQTDGGKAKYGAFGYWVAFVDPAGQ